MVGITRGSNRTRLSYLLDRAEVLGPIFIAPAILYMVALLGLPFLLAIYFSLTDVTINNIQLGFSFVGLENFIELFRDRIFQQALQNTLIFAVSSQLLAIILGQATAFVLITGIGHEVDVSIADLVADYHAHTPTQAAQVAVAHWKRAHESLERVSVRLTHLLRQMLIQARQRLVWIERHEVFRRPTDRINRLLQRLDDYQRQLEIGLQKTADRCKHRLTVMESRLSLQHPRSRVMIFRAKVENLENLLYRSGLARLRNQQQTVEALDRQLQALNPNRVLERGYSMTFRKKDQKIIRSVREIRPGDVLITRFHEGQVESLAQDPDQPELF